MTHWPDLIGVRRVVLPVLERNEQRLFGRDVMFSKALQPRCFAGVVEDASVWDLREQLHDARLTYPVNTATMKYHETVAGRAYEHGSYAFRPQGFLGREQFHWRVWNHVAGAGVSAHYELNPWRHPVRHYRGDEWDPDRGVQLAREWFDLAPGDVAGIRP